jgi:hypothetical protein
MSTKSESPCALKTDVEVDCQVDILALFTPLRRIEIREIFPNVLSAVEAIEHRITRLLELREIL